LAKFKTLNTFHKFLLKAGLLYAVCYFVYELILKKYTRFDQYFIRIIINACEQILSFLNYKTFSSKEINDFQVFGIDGSNGVWIGGPCNGITLMFLFAIFIIAYPGNLKHKLWYLPLGMILVYGLNLFRIISLSLIAYYNPSYLEFNHTYTFTFIAYSFVFSLWMLWVNKFSKEIKKP
jgi:exosortase family protein XrtF